MTAHSLEPLRPWKAEQLGGGYALSSWCERTAVESAAAVIAVSDGMRSDVLACYPAVDPARVRVIRNGIDTVQYTPDHGTDVLEKYGVDAGPADGAVRRPDHPAEGRAGAAARRRAARPGRPAGAVRGPGRTPRPWPPRSPRWSTACASSGPGWSG